MFALLVGDVDSCRSGLSGEGGDLHPEPLTQVGVEVGQRLVEQQQLGLGHYGAGQCDALLLPPGQLVGIPRGVLAQPDPLQRGLAAHPGSSLAQVSAAQRVAGVARDARVRPQA